MAAKKKKLHVSRKPIGPYKYGSSAESSTKHLVSPYLGTMSSFSGSSLHKTHHEYLIWGQKILHWYTHIHNIQNGVYLYSTSNTFPTVTIVEGTPKANNTYRINLGISRDLCEVLRLLNDNIMNLKKSHHKHHKIRMQKKYSIFHT